MFLVSTGKDISNNAFPSPIHVPASRNVTVKPHQDFPLWPLSTTLETEVRSLVTGPPPQCSFATSFLGWTLGMCEPVGVEGE